MSVPLWKSFGKSINDLLSQKYDFERQAKFKTLTKSGLTFETTARTSRASEYAGALRTIYTRPDYGIFDVELDTEGYVNFSTEADQLAKGVVLKISGNHVPVYGVDVTYRRENLSTSAGVSQSKKGFALDGTAAVGQDGLSVGAQGRYDLTDHAVTDYNAGVEYAQPDHTIAVKTANSASKLALSYVHTLNPDFTVGGQFVYNLASVSPVTSELTVGTSYVVSRDTLVKSKFSSGGIVTAALDQRLFNPKLQLGLAAEFDARHQSLTPERFGVSLTFGDH